MVTAYQQFVKDHIGEFKHLPAKERMKHVAALYKGKSVQAPAKKGRGRPKKGGSLLGDIVPFGNMLGLGLDEKPKKGKGRPKKGGSLLGDIVPFGNMLGLGLDEKKGGAMTAAGLPAKRGKGKYSKVKYDGDETGGSIFGDIVPFGNMLGLGLDEKPKKGKGRPKKGGMMTGAGMTAAGFNGTSPTMSGGNFGDFFFKGLTAPFALASKIPLPGLQQIGQAGTSAFNAIGAPTFF